MKIATCLTVLLLALFLFDEAPAHQTADPKDPITVFLVRHAETAASTKTNRDPALSDAGNERAGALAKLLSESGVTHLYSSSYERTRTTLAPLAADLELEVTQIDPGKKELYVKALEELAPGSVAVVCGHSNTIPELLVALGGKSVGKTLDHDQYNRLFIVTLPGAPAVAVKSLELRYGS